MNDDVVKLVDPIRDNCAILDESIAKKYKICTHKEHIQMHKEFEAKLRIQKDWYKPLRQAPALDLEEIHMEYMQNYKLSQEDDT